ncbi:MAG TPA: helix-turn-helix domain-containing protein [Longimicrobium sp.]|nr:helix-turn-helix domain-containing protein [Longimicrobium sp.]
MPIIVKLDDVLYARRMTLTELSERIGITLANLSILKTGKARAVRFSTLVGVVLVPLVLPWPYIIAKYLKTPDDPWRTPAPATL